MVDRATTSSRVPRSERTDVDAPLHQRLLEHSRVLGSEQDDDLRRDSLPPHLRPVFDDLLLASQVLAGHDEQVAAFRDHAERTQEWVRKMCTRDREQAASRLEAVTAGEVSPDERVQLHGRSWRREPAYDLVSRFPAAGIVHLCFADDGDMRERVWLQSDKTCYRIPATKVPHGT